jgi:hypothetical protein
VTKTPLPAVSSGSIEEDSLSFVVFVYDRTRGRERRPADPSWRLPTTTGAEEEKKVGGGISGSTATTFQQPAEVQLPHDKLQGGRVEAAHDGGAAMTRELQP